MPRIKETQNSPRNKTDGVAFPYAVVELADKEEITVAQIAQIHTDWAAAQAKATGKSVDKVPTLTDILIMGWNRSGWINGKPSTADPDADRGYTAQERALDGKLLAVLGNPTSAASQRTMAELAGKVKQLEPERRTKYLAHLRAIGQGKLAEALSK